MVDLLHQRQTMAADMSSTHSVASPLSSLSQSASAASTAQSNGGIAATVPPNWKAAFKSNQEAAEAFEKDLAPNGGLNKQSYEGNLVKFAKRFGKYLDQTKQTTDPSRNVSHLAAQGDEAFTKEVEAFLGQIKESDQTATQEATELCSDTKSVYRGHAQAYRRYLTNGNLSKVRTNTKLTAAHDTLIQWYRSQFVAANHARPERNLTQLPNMEIRHQTRGRKKIAPDHKLNNGQLGKCRLARGLLSKYENDGGFQKKFAGLRSEVDPVSKRHCANRLAWMEWAKKQAWKQIDAIVSEFSTVHSDRSTVRYFFAKLRGEDNPPKPKYPKPPKSARPEQQ
jgi:hypothetical protein